jgi:formate-dependent nitrite reductase cytochrome c552 subunit
MGGKRAKPTEPFNETTLLSHHESNWLLKTSIIGNCCISHPKGQLLNLVGDLICLGQKFYDDATQETQWWETPNHTEPQPHLLANFPKLAIAWNNLTTGIEWQAPKGLCWICGE